MVDLDLQIRGGGGVGAGHSDPETRGGSGGGRFQNVFFWPFGPQFGLKIGSADLPWIRHWARLTVHSF